MESSNNDKMRQQLTLLLIYLSTWDEKDIAGDSIYRAWKGYDFEVMDRLKEKGILNFQKPRNRFIFLTTGYEKPNLC
jgi:hypothetical protein